MSDGRRLRFSAASVGVALLAAAAVALVGYAALGSGGRAVAQVGTTPGSSTGVGSKAQSAGLVDAVDKPLAVWIGDTWISGINGGGISQGVAAQASRALGMDWVVESQPQTGWATKGLSGVQGLNTAYPDRVASTVALRPRLVVVAGGSNDAVRGASAADVSAGVLKTVTGLRAGLGSGVPIVIVGPTWPSVPVPAAVLATEATVETEADALKVPFIDPLAGQWVTAENAATYEKAGFLTEAGNTALAKRFVTDLHRLGVMVPSH